MIEQEQEPKDPREALRNFVTESKVRAFVETYAPANDATDSDRNFTTADLRKYFDAYAKTIGDPLSIYVDDWLVGVHHFRFVTSPVLDEPVMPVNYRAL